MSDLSRVFSLFLLAALAGCGEPGNKDAAATDAEARSSVAGASKPSRSERRSAAAAAACELLADSMIRSRLGLGEDVALAHDPSQYSPHPLCTVSWAKANAAELEQERVQLMTDYMQRKMRGEDVPMPSFRTTDEVSLTIYSPAFDSKAQALAGFESAMKRLSDGVTASAGDVDFTYQADVEPVSGVGDKAMWVPKMRQLSFVSGNRLLHLTVNTGQDLSEELATARGLAEDVMAALQGS